MLSLPHILPYDENYRDLVFAVEMALEFIRVFYDEKFFRENCALLLDNGDFINSYGVIIELQYRQKFLEELRDMFIKSSRM